MHLDILIVDDSLTVRTDLQSALTAAGYQVTACATLGAARDELERRRFALLILDVLLPDGDGIELLREIRADPVRAGTRVIMLSTEAEVGSRVRGITTGADEYVGKPYDPSYVLRCVRRFLGAGAAGIPTPDRGLGERKILAIGARSTYLAVLAERLRLDRHDVTITHSMEEAAQLLAVTTVDCIVVDASTQDFDGADICRRLKQTPAWASIPVLLLKEAVAPGVTERPPSLDADAVAPRSTNLTSVRARLRDLLRQQATDSKRQGELRAPDSGSAGPLFARVVAASGLPTASARSTLEETFRRIGLEAGAMTPEDLQRAIPALEVVLQGHMPTEEVRWRLQAIGALARLAAGRRG